MKQLKADRYNSSVGELVMVADGGRLCYLDFADNAGPGRRMEKLLRARYGEYTITAAPNADLRARLDRYFAGEYDAFDGMDLHPHGTDFQRAVWRALQKISPGKAISYRQLATAVKKPSAIRAAASANANNPIAVIIPCHRVIGADGSLRGYTGGTDRQAWLLNHEGAQLGGRIK